MKNNKKNIFKSLDNLMLILFFIFLIAGVLFKNQIKEEVNFLLNFGGYVLMFILCFFLEPTIFIIGPFAVQVSAAALGFNPFYTIFTIVIAVTLSGILAFFLGYKYPKKITKYIDDNKLKRYKKFFKKYGTYAMIINALLPMPYLALFAGIFKIKPNLFLFLVTPIRIIRYILISLFLFWIL